MSVVELMPVLQAAKRQRTLQQAFGNGGGGGGGAGAHPMMMMGVTGINGMNPLMMERSWRDDGLRYTAEFGSAVALIFDQIRSSWGGSSWGRSGNLLSAWGLGQTQLHRLHLV